MSSKKGISKWSYHVGSLGDDLGDHGECVWNDLQTLMSRCRVGNLHRRFFSISDTAYRNRGHYTPCKTTYVVFLQRTPDLHINFQTSEPLSQTKINKITPPNHPIPSHPIPIPTIIQHTPFPTRQAPIIAQAAATAIVLMRPNLSPM